MHTNITMIHDWMGSIYQLALLGMLIPINKQGTQLRQGNNEM
jgi:hypothetical protein